MWIAVKNLVLRCPLGALSIDHGSSNSGPLSVRITRNVLRNTMGPSPSYNWSKTSLTAACVQTGRRNTGMKEELRKSSVIRHFPASLLPFTVSISTTSCSGNA